MLCAILALIAAGCFVFMVVAIVISLQLSDKLHRVERELERQKRTPPRGSPDSLAREIRKGMLYQIAKMSTREG
jgi:tRNA(Ile)-lysidine synthase TilS/MesJ